ncbi:MAG: Gfo/Idh/MocA family oxidoreductase, partial [Anaerolineae bacterium]|nr:Gfo/Idh/MocA family oxidoreductase [Anaerolineae bacterium]
LMGRQSVHLAFVGSGNWARKYHFPTLAYLTQRSVTQELGVDLYLRGIYSLDSEIAAGVATETGFEHVYPSLDALLDDEAVDAIAVAVTPSALASVLKRVIAKGVPIFSEKPPGVTTQEAKGLSDLITVPNVLAFNRRFIPLNNTFKDLVENLADIYYVEGAFYRHQRMDETFMIGTGIHWINFMEYLFGEIQDVNVERFPNPSNNTVNRIAQLTFPNKLRGQLKVFQCAGAQVERIEVHSASRSLTLYGPLWEQPGRIIIHEGAQETIIDPEATNPLPEIIRLGIVGEYVEFLTKACAGLPTRSNFQNAVNSMRVAEVMEVIAAGRESEQEVRSKQ